MAVMVHPAAWLALAAGAVSCATAIVIVLVEKRK